MIKDISKVFQNSFSTLQDSGIISQLEGLVRTHEYKTTGAEKTTKIPVPVECAEAEFCVDCESIKVCVPHKSKKCIVYIEGNTANPKQNLEGATRYETSLSLVCWYNKGFFEEDVFLQTKFIGTFTDLIKKTSSAKSESCPMVFNNAEILRVWDNDPAIFSKYTYNELKSDFLGCKFSSFKIDFNVKFLVYENTDCIGSILGIDNDNDC